MIDTHCHLHDRRYDDDRDATVQRAREAGVSAMLTVGCDVDDSAAAIETARAFGLAASVGIHPHEARHAPDDVGPVFDELRRRGARVVAVGETGLDYYYDHSPRERQAEVFRAQLRYARERHLPLIFHQRDAEDDFVAVLREEFRPPMRGVVHCFTGNAEVAQMFTREFGLVLGIGGVLTFANADSLREAVRTVGLQALILETDAPYLAPVPLRGKRNEPAFVPHVADKLAEIFGTTREDVSAITDRNAKELFGL